MEIAGLPLHPLVVHAVVVLVPLASLGGLLISLWPAARQRYGWLTVAFAFAAASSTLLAQRSGEAFAETFRRQTEAMATHIGLGPTLLPWVITLFGGTVAVMVAQLLIERRHPYGRIALLVGGAVTVVGASVSIVQVLRIGHSGAIAVWG